MVAATRQGDCCTGHDSCASVNRRQFKCFYKWKMCW